MAVLHSALAWQSTGSAKRRVKHRFDSRRSTRCKDFFMILWLHLHQAVGFKIWGSRMLWLLLMETVSHWFTFECNLSPQGGREDLRHWLQHFCSVQPLAHILKPGDRGKVLWRDGEKRWGRPVHAGNPNPFVQSETSQQRYHMRLAPKLHFVLPSNMVTSCNSSTPQPFKEQSESYTRLYWSGCCVSSFNTAAATLSHIHVSIRP